MTSGCKPDSHLVSVDVEKVLKEDAPAPPKVSSVPRPPAATPGFDKSLPGQPQLELKDPSRASRGNIAAVIAKQQEDALAIFQGRLRAFYQTQMDAFTAEQGRLLERLHGQNYAEVFDKIHTAFLPYAAARAPKVARFALIVGYPDPNPNSDPPKTVVKPYIWKRYDEAKQIRTDLTALDTQFHAKVDDLLKDVKDLNAMEAAAMADRLMKFQEELNKRAETEAQEQVRTSAKELGLKLTDVKPVVLPATGTRSVHFPAEPALTPVPQVPSQVVNAGVAERRLLLTHELEIWLGLKQYRLGKSGRDGTEEFRKWRETYRAGL